MGKRTAAERGLDSLKTGDEKRDAEPEQVNLDAQKTASALEALNEDAGALSEGEVFIPAKRPRTTPATKPEKNEFKGRPKTKSGNPKKNGEKKDKSTNGNEVSHLLQPLHEKSKPINLRTAV
jgi:hypothetical protein